MSDCSDCLKLTAHPPVGDVPAGTIAPAPMSTPACIRCATQVTLMPILEKELARLMKIKIAPIIPSRPGPDPSPFFELERDLVKGWAAGDPEPQPNILSRELRLKAATAFRKVLTATRDLVDKEIESLQG